MAKSKKIKDGAFAGSYTAPKKRRWGRIAIIVAVALIVVGVAGWLVWRHEAGRRLDADAYQSAIASSEGLPYTHLDSTQQNARFQECSGVTMDAYLARSVKIADTSKRYQCAQVLSAAKHYDESFKLYDDLMSADDLGDVSEAELIEGVLGTSRAAGNREVHDRAMTRYKAYMTDKGVDVDMQAVLIDAHGWSDEYEK